MKGSVAKKCERDASSWVFQAIREQLGVLVDEIKDEKGDAWEDYKKSRSKIDLRRALELIKIQKAKNVLRALRAQRIKKKLKLSLTPAPGCTDPRETRRRN